MTSGPASGAPEPTEPEGPAEHDLERAELVESAGLQNAWAVVGPGALLAVPLAWALTRLRRLVTRR